MREHCVLLLVQVTAYKKPDLRGCGRIKRIHMSELSHKDVTYRLHCEHNLTLTSEYGCQRLMCQLLSTHTTKFGAKEDREL